MILNKCQHWDIRGDTFIPRGGISERIIRYWLWLVIFIRHKLSDPSLLQLLLLSQHFLPLGSSSVAVWPQKALRRSDMCVFCLCQQQKKKKKKATMDKVGVCVYSPISKPHTHIHIHAMLVEPWPSTADIHHDKLPSPVCPFCKVNVVVDMYELYIEKVCFWAPLCMCVCFVCDR